MAEANSQEASTARDAHPSMCSHSTVIKRLLPISLFLRQDHIRCYYFSITPSATQVKYSPISLAGRLQAFIMTCPPAVRNEAEAGVPPLQTPEAFPFPYARPYDIQVQLMKVVFEAIESGKIAIVRVLFCLHQWDI
jgi:hypothetical protein